MTGQQKMITDMNDRERKRFSEQFLVVREFIDKMVVALAAGGDADDQLVPAAFALSIAFPALMQELLGILGSATWVDMSDLDRPIEEPKKEGDA